MLRKNNIVKIFTDGACSGNPGPGGWGVFITYSNGENKRFYGHNPDTTNNQMELQAIIEGINKVENAEIIYLYTDSKYVHLGITDWINKWQKNNWTTSNKQPVKNKELWQKLLSLKQNNNIVWHWVKGHDNNQGNIIADQLAQKGKNMNSKTL